MTMLLLSKNRTEKLTGFFNRHLLNTWSNIEFRVPYSQRYLVLGLVGLVGLGLPLLLRLGSVGFLALWLVSGIVFKIPLCIFIYNEIVHEYTEYKEKQRETKNERGIELRHTERFNNKINVRST